MRNGSLWSTCNVVFETEVNFHEFDFETSELDFEVSKSSIWKHTTGCFFFYYYYISQLRRPIELKFSQVCHFVHTVYSDTPSEKSGLWQLPIVSSAFNEHLFDFFELLPILLELMLNLILGVMNFHESPSKHSLQLMNFKRNNNDSPN